MFEDDFQKKIWKDKYQYKNESFSQYCNRIAVNIFPDSEEYRKKLINYLKDFKVLFGGRINSNIGTDEEGVTLINCYISPMLNNPDSLGSILQLASNYANTLKTEGGVGFCANFLRPANTLIRKIGVTTPGSVKFLELFDKLSEIITSGNVDPESSYQGSPTKKSIRKGATMITMSVCHPDIEEFITAKSTPNRLTKMNMSVLVTDAFMHAVNNNLDWDLWFPDINFNKYETEWDGDFEKWAEKNYPYVIYKTIKAVELWELLLKSTYSRNEPGCLFIDNVRKMDNLHYLDNCSITATNPCVSGDTLVTTNNGVYYANEIIKNQTIQTTNEFGPVENLNIYDNCDMYRVYFLDGSYQDVTAAHIFHSKFNQENTEWNEDVQLTDLKIGGIVRKEWYKVYPNKNTTLTRDDGLLIGFYLCSEGSFSYDSFGIPTHYFRDSEFISNLYKRLGGYIKNSNDTYYFINSSMYLQNLFSLLNMHIKTRIFSIKDLLNTNREFIFGLIDGMLSLNSNIIHNSAYTQIEFRHFSIDIHDLIRHLLLFVKVNYKFYMSAGKGYTGIIEFDSITNLFSRIKYISDPIKNKELKNIINTFEFKEDKWETKIIDINYIGKGTVYDFYELKTDNWNHGGFVSRGCGEVPGSTGMVTYKGKEYTLGDICDLGSLNLTRFYNVKTKQFNYKDIYEAEEILIRGLDKVIDISNYPLDIYKDAAVLKRKIGFGIMGVGSLMMMMDIKYGSKECISFLNDLVSKLMNKAYQISAMMAREFGTFPLYDKKCIEGGYVKNSGVLTKETIDLIKKYGLRNSALCAIAPNGSLSIVAGNISGGLEPVFSPEFTRWNRVEGKKVNFNYPNIHKGEWFETDYLKEQEIADEVVLISTDGEYRIDKNSGLCKQVVTRDYGYNVALNNKFENVTCARDLSIDEHLNVLKVFADTVDQSCSKTINLPADISFEKFKALYSELHSLGIKGCTTYRDGTSIGVLEVKKKSVKKQQKEFIGSFENQNNNIIAKSVHLPEEYPAKGYILHSEGKKWYIHMAFKDIECTRPFAIFVNTNSREDNTTTFSTIDKLEELAIVSGLDEDKINEIKMKYAYQKNPVKICRMLGLLLRHNVQVDDIIKTMDLVDGAIPGTFVHRIKHFLCKFTKNTGELLVCPSCNTHALEMESGCWICRECGYSKCS